MFGQHGKNLIFLISQPRAGSTMLQRILGCHPDIHTLSEPWIMLHSLYALKKEGHQADYNTDLSFTALQEFMSALPNGEEDYFEGIRLMSTYLYGQAMINTGKKRFLDKTPRYYLIIPQLLRTFPDAHFVVLLRNPLAVMASIARTWAKEEWLHLRAYKCDLLNAPDLLCKGIDLLADRAAVVHYEKLLSSPENETKKICNEIGVEYFPDMIEYGGHNMPEWRFGDTVEVYNLKRPASEKSDKWMEYTKDPQMWRLMDDYLHDLGPETLNKLGYPYEDLRETLKEHTPPPRRLLSTLSLNKLLKEEQELRNLEFYYEKLLASLQKRGLQATLTEGILRLMSRL